MVRNQKETNNVRTLCRPLLPLDLGQVKGLDVRRLVGDTISGKPNLLTEVLTLSCFLDYSGTLGFAIF